MAASPASLTRADLGALHGTLGNRVVQRMLSGAAQRRTGAARSGGSSRAARGLPEDLKTGIESLSGLSMDGVSVHYNSPKPAQVDALAFAAGSEIHMGPGSEEHLPHEAWHLVQQRQGRVAPSMNIGGMGVNTDVSLEREADVMGQRATSLHSGPVGAPGEGREARGAPSGGSASPAGAPVHQMIWRFPVPSATRDITGVKGKAFREHAHLERLSMAPTQTGVWKYGVREVKNARSYDADSGELEYVRQDAQEYRITDTSLKFYHTTDNRRAAKYLRNGMGPTTNYDQRGMSAWTSSGWFYMSMEEPESNSKFVKILMTSNAQNTTTLVFTLPAGSIVSLDPESGSALRTKATIPAGNIKKWKASAADREKQAQRRDDLHKRIDARMNALNTVEEEPQLESTSD